VASDLTTYETQYKLTPVPVTQISVNNAGVAAKADVLGEDMLDLDALVGLNNALAGIRLYTDGKDSFQVGLVDALNLMATDDLCSVISISYAFSEPVQGTAAIQAENTVFEQMAAQGQTVFASAGDGDARANDPASQPYVTGVGGTTLNLVAKTQAWSSETVWNDAANAEGTGGGISSVWPIPSYQLVNGVSVAAANGGSSTMRNIPDVTADGDPNTGYSTYCPGSKCFNLGWGVGGGTSLAAPIWAAMTSIVNADRVAKKQPRVGFYNPTLYSLGKAGKGFHDITVGNNIAEVPNPTGFTAGPGYDNTSGWGSLDLAVYLKLPGIKP
jgi:kumamolisin